MKNKNLSGGLFASGKPQPLAIRETPLSAQIAEWLDARHVYNDRLNCGKVETKRGNWIHLCKTGTPDRFAILSGQIIFIEVKMRGEKPTGEQRSRHSELRDAGAIVVVADSFEQFINHFSAIRAAVCEREKEMNLYD